MSITAKVAQGLQAAHDAGVLHRDVKPENVLIMESGEPTLSDFGISRLANSTVTVTRGLRLTLAHVAPEVLNGDRATTASDVYSLASTAYRLLTGRWPHQGRPDEPDAALLLRTVTQNPPGLEQFGVPRPVAEVVARGMDRDPSARWPSALVLGHEIAAAGLGEFEPDGPLGLAQRDTRLLEVPVQQPTSVVTALLQGPARPGPTAVQPVAPSRLLTAEDVRRCQFPITFRGYAITEVDAFLERVAHDLDGRAGGGAWQGALTAADVSNQQFHVAFRGYRLDAVDALLGQVEATLRALDGWG